MSFATQTVVVMLNRGPSLDCLPNIFHGVTPLGEDNCFNFSSYCCVDQAGVSHLADACTRGVILQRICADSHTSVLL